MAMHIRNPNITVYQNLKISKAKMVDDGHLEKNRDISETVWPIFTKFCKMAHISSPELAS